MDSESLQLIKQQLSGPTGKLLKEFFEQRVTQEATSLIAPPESIRQIIEREQALGRMQCFMSLFSEIEAHVSRAIQEANKDNT